MSEKQSATPEGLETPPHCPDHAECTYPECCGMDECANCAAILAERTRGAKALADARAEAEALRVALRAVRGLLERARPHVLMTRSSVSGRDDLIAGIDAALAEGPQHPSGVVPAAGQPAALGQTGVDALRVEFTKRGLGEALMLLDLAVAVTASGSAPAGQPGPSGNRTEEEGRNG